MENYNLRQYCKSILPSNFNEEKLWINSDNPNDYVSKVQEIVYAQSPPSYASPVTQMPTINDILHDEFKTHSGIFNCRRCKHKITNYKTEQRRSADEGATIIGTCPKCNTQTVQNS